MGPWVLSHDHFAAAGFVCLLRISLGRGITLRRGHRIHQSSGYARDQTRAALEGYATPRPAQGDRQAVAKADEEVDVGNGPQQPRWKSRELEATKLCNGTLAAEDAVMRRSKANAIGAFERSALRASLDQKWNVRRW
jgi:hypothetical protein